jgi:hypothetical protein
MKTTVKQLAAGTFIALLLLVGNVNAEGTEAKASSHETIETTLQLEKWMTDEFIWNTNSVNITDFSQETETGLELESWMTNQESWSLSNSFVEETEAAMELENWMTNETEWNVNNLSQDTELTVEYWMVDNKIW